MKIKHHEIEIPQENPFANCQLAREPYARVLTDIVNTYADGFVLAINNEWGTGKTTFVKMWQQQLKNEGFQTIYFNAWENDFDSNPLVALMSELETLTNAKNEKVFKSVVEKGAVLVKNIAPALLKALANKYIGSEVLADIVENTTKASTEILEEGIKEYSAKKITIKEFRIELEKFVKQDNNSKPVVFIVDELDRCRPNYSVEVLEQIKHFFSVSGIVFVLSIDKKQLGAAVEGYYGSNKINSSEYLRRFIDLEYSIPAPESRNIVSYFFKYYAFDQFFYNSERANYRDYSEDGKQFQLIAYELFSKYQPTLRQQEKIFAHARVVINSFHINEYVLPNVVYILCFLRQMDPDTYGKFETRNLSIAEVVQLVSDMLSINDGRQSRINKQYVLALIIRFYCNFDDSSTRVDLDDLSQLEVLRAQLSEANVNVDVGVFQYIEAIRREVYGNFSLESFFGRINLTARLTTA